MSVRWQEHRTSEFIRRTLQRDETVTDTNRKRKLQLLGHVCRMSDGGLLKTLMSAIMVGRPARKCSNVRQSDVVQQRHKRRSNDDRKQRKTDYLLIRHNNFDKYRGYLGPLKMGRKNG